ncbi:MAG: class I SAM-dependent methyltransferase [bacterium]|nr:class I SAM-dependent methyltransferase [bacterium]
MDKTLLIEEIRAQAVNPPGNDKYIGAFYESVCAQIDQQNPKIHEILADTLAFRPEITDKHFANLLFRTFQYLETNIIKNSLYPNGFDCQQTWEKELLSLVENPSLFPVIKNLLRTKNTTTTIYQRYVGPHAIMAAVFKSKIVSFADFGSGAAYGPLGMISKTTFNPFVDNTDNCWVQNQLMKNIKFDKVYSIDKQCHDGLDNNLWLRACQFYPSERETHLLTTCKFEQKVKLYKERVTFVEADITQKLDIEPCDAVTICTTLYMLPKFQKEIIKIAQKILKKDGIIIIQDFAKIANDEATLNFKVSWTKDFPYRTFILSQKTNWKIWEVLKWNNGRCKEVNEGHDFNKFLNMLV